jgi:glycosyltransferase involved in cell wall biosynthesis
VFTIRVSVIMPNFNKEEYIAQAIESVLSQEFEDWELIIVDDNSTDNSRNVIDKFQDGRISKIYLAQRVGVSKARNIGIRKAKGELVAFLDSDDIYTPDKLSLQVARYRDFGDQQAIIYSDWFSIRNGKVETQSHFPRGAPQAEGMILDYLLASRSIVNSALLIPKRDFETVGYYDEHLKVAEDLEMLYRLALKFPFAIVKKPIYGYRIGIRSTSTEASHESYLSHVKILEKYIKLCTFRSKDLERRAYRRLLGYMAAAHLYRKMALKILSNRHCFAASFSYLREGYWFKNDMKQ